MRLKKGFFLFILIFLSTNLFSQDILSNLNASWSNVLTGKVLCTPQKTRQGFAVITDARNLCNFSTDGNLLWEKKLTKVTNPFFSVLENGFFAVVTNSGKRLSIWNREGKEIWFKTYNEKISGLPFSGRDDRIFVRSKNHIFCYGISGLLKWSLETPDQNTLEPAELPDGTLIIFFSQLQDGKTKAWRITPFGEILEDITFAGEVTSSLTTEKGILLTFTDGSAGLFATEDNKAAHKWLLQKENREKSNKDFFVLSQNRKDVIYINHKSNGVEVDFIELDSGSIKQAFTIPGLKNIIFSACNDSGFLVADSDFAAFYNNRGIEIWSGKLPDKKSRDSFNYLFFTEDNYFLVFGVNWSLNAYRTAQNATYKNKKKNTEKKPDYSQFFRIDVEAFSDIYKTGIDSNITDSERAEELKKGDYGKKEQEWISQLLSSCQMYKNSLSTSDFGIHIEKSIFETDTAGLQKMLSTLCLFDTNQFIDYTAYFLRKEKNKTLLHTLLSGIQINPYDPDFLLLDTLENLSNTLTAKDQLLLSDIINCVYKICDFNGIEALNYKGKDILKTFLYPSYSASTRTSARTALKNLLSN